jgi:hypothetical protein
MGLSWWSKKGLTSGRLETLRRGSLPRCPQSTGGRFAVRYFRGSMQRTLFVAGPRWTAVESDKAGPIIAPWKPFPEDAQPDGVSCAAVLAPAVENFILGSRP